MNVKDTFVPRKSLGQNFLINPRIIARIIDACSLKSDDIVCEIGPGQGALTHLLGQRVAKLVAIEKDRRLAEQLKKEFTDTNVEIIHADILKYPLETLARHSKFIGNLPYSAATAIIARVLTHRPAFGVFFMTVQREYAKRMTARPSSPAYGSFSCFVQYYACAKILFPVKNSAFKPMPKVQSCFLRLDLRRHPENAAKSEVHLFKLIRACFEQRRKTILNSLGAFNQDKTKTLRLLESLQIDPQWRAENLSLEDFVRISNTLVA